MSVIAREAKPTRVCDDGDDCKPQTEQHVQNVARMVRVLSSAFGQKQQVRLKEVTWSV